MLHLKIKFLEITAMALILEMGIALNLKATIGLIWKSTGDLGTYYVGTGEYSFEDEMLVLNFDNNIETSRSKVKIERMPIDSSDEVHLRFKIFRQSTTTFTRGSRNYKARFSSYFSI